MTWRSTVSKLLGAALLVSALLRVDLATAFGTGSGVNRVRVSALSVTTHFGMVNIPRLPAQAQHVAVKLLTALAVPGEVAMDYGLLPPRKTKPSKKKGPETLERRAMNWCNGQKNSRAMSKFVEENTFALAGGLVAFFSSLFAFFLPYEGFGNTLLGLGLFWIGANGAHGEDVQFSAAFYVLVAVLAVALYVLAEESPERAEARKQRAEAAKKKKKDDDYDWENDGIGGVSRDVMRQRKEPSAGMSAFDN